MLILWFGIPSYSVVSDCDPRVCSPPGSCVHGVLQARIRGWVAISFSRGSTQPRDRTWVSGIPKRRFTFWATREVQHSFSSLQFSHSVMSSSLRSHESQHAAKSLQSCPTLCNPIDSGPSGSTIPGILQARTLERVAISFSNAWKGKVKVKSLSRVRLLATPWTAAYQASPSMGFSRQEYWSEVPLPSPRRSNYLWIGLWQIMEDYTYPLVNLFLPGDSKLL